MEYEKRNTLGFFLLINKQKQFKIKFCNTKLIMKELEIMVRVIEEREVLYKILKGQN